MGWLRKFKSKNSLEKKLAREDIFSVKSKKDTPQDYEEFPVKGAGETIEETENNFVKNSKTAGARYVSGIIGPHKMNNQNFYILSAIAYRPSSPDAA